MAKLSILVVDDETSQREVLSGYLRKKKHVVFSASSVPNALKTFTQHSIDLILTDLKMPDLSGIDLLTKVRALHPDIAVVVMTAFGTIEGAVDALQKGAFSYLTKPINLDELDVLVGRIAERNQLVSENRILKEQLAEKFSFKEIVSRSDAMDRVLQMAARVAQSDAAVLVRGESGTGKELIAKTIHFSSSRRANPFIAVNCAALNANLLESELFGHEKGAFTGADRQRRGRFEMAEGGTLFLDEIGDIAPATQVRLLRVLQEKEFERVGGNETLHADVRIIAATNKNLEKAIADGAFREDLYYRLNVVSIEIAPLRQRREDVSMLLDHYLQHFARQQKRPALSFSKEARDILLRYDYPGNVRELENVVLRAVVLSHHELITTADLPSSLRDAPAESASTRNVGSLEEQVENLEKDLVFEALRISSNNQSKAAELLGLSERNLRYRLKKWNVKR
ncbi:MAG: sigma-54 dependent transcriptional regulator [Ignavibacteriales bacterium]|nr:sigma-54 dependent transcriptional regulator [Ignavibacteriales bacterium]